MANPNEAFRNRFAMKHELGRGATGEVHLIVVRTPAERDESDRGLSTGRNVTVTWQVES